MWIDQKGTSWQRTKLTDMWMKKCLDQRKWIQETSEKKSINKFNYSLINKIKTKFLWLIVQRTTTIFVQEVLIRCKQISWHTRVYRLESFILKNYKILLTFHDKFKQYHLNSKTYNYCERIYLNKFMLCLHIPNISKWKHVERFLHLSSIY